MNCSDGSSAAYIASLQQLSSVAQSLKPAVLSAFRRAGRQPPSTPPPDFNEAHLNIPSLSLAIPDEIASYLQRTGCSPTVASSLSDAFIRSAHQIRAVYGTSYRQIAGQLASDPSRFPLRLERLKLSLRAQYEKKITSAKQVALDRANNLARQRHNVQAKPKFNQEFVPLLETYFQYNAYPSAPDRAVLARKSMMTPRQIEVWFQNHRNRSNKEGKILRRLTSDPLPLKLSLEVLEKKMSFFIIPKAGRKSSVGSTGPESGDESDQEIHATGKFESCASFHLDAPLHAYPAIYPPTCDYDPFPIKSAKHTFPAPVWMRRPTSSAPRPVSHNLDDFITDFAHKLTFRDTPLKKYRQSGDSSAPSQCPWYAATYTTPSPAPHPALIRTPVFIWITPTTRQPRSATPTLSSHSHPFCSPSPFSRPVTLVPAEKAENSGRRKIARLPRRTPKHPRLIHRGASPAVSDTSSSSPSPSPASRTPSFSSDFLFDRRSFSSSGSSTSSSTLTTPECSTMLLPNDGVSSCLSDIDETVFGAISALNSCSNSAFSDKHPHRSHH